MIIKDITVAGVGRFASRTRLAGLAPGLNVLSAPNEAGKSTLFRALRACLFQRHTSEAIPIRELATSEAALPVEISVAFSVEGRDYAITKSFLRSKSALLIRDGVEYARGAKADDVVWEVLGLEPGSGRASIDTNSFGLLWVEQSHSFKPPEPSDGARDALRSIIASEVGTLVGGERARAILDAVTDALAERETQRGPKAGGPLKVALDEAARLRQEEAGLREKRAELETEFGALERLRAEFERLRDPRVEAELRSKRDDARVARDTARAAVADLKTRKLEVDAAQERCARADERLSAARDARKRLDESAERMAALGDEMVAAQEQANAAEERSRAATEALVLGDTALARADEALRRHIAAVEAADATSRLAGWVARRDELTTLKSRIAEIEAALAKTLATPERLKNARALQERIVGLEARLDAQAGRLEIRLASDAAGAVTVDGEAIGERFAKALRGPTRVSVAGIGEIAITPPEAGDAQERELAQARRELAAVLDAMGCASIASAMDALDGARTLRSEADGLRPRIDAIAAEFGRNDPAAALGQRIAAAQAVIANATTDAVALPGDRDALEERRREAARARSLAEAAKAEARERHIAAQTRLASLRSRLDEQKGRVESARADSRSIAGEDVLALRAQERDAAAQALDALRRSCREQEEATPDAEQIALAEARADRLEQALDNLRRDIDRTEHDIRSREEIVRRLGADGLDERLARVEQERAMAERELVRVQRATDALRLLRDEIASGLAEGRSRFIAPVMENLRPYLGALFPGAELEIGDDFSPARLTRASADEAFDLLSDGTREQIAVLVRLALGAMLAKNGHATPIILDDALVFSDDARIETMFDALARAAQRQQVIVLTCRSRAFAPIGGASLRIEPA
ncbi:MAG: AAA family ATPase [Microvirga sp.]|nr:AAA family ATPase [Microvirga sp.]